jgi:hypothetical protein
LHPVARVSYDRRGDRPTCAARIATTALPRAPRGDGGGRRISPAFGKGEQMATYRDLQDRIDRGDVIILDGAVGTGLQNMGVPMHGTAWAAAALQTHPYTVRHLHEVYIKADVDVLTTNTYSAARHNLEPLGLGDLVAELNIRAVMLARDARDKVARDRPVFIGCGLELRAGHRG